MFMSNFEDEAEDGPRLDTLATQRAIRDRDELRSATVSLLQAADSIDQARRILAIIDEEEGGVNDDVDRQNHHL